MREWSDNSSRQTRLCHGMVLSLTAQVTVLWGVSRAASRLPVDSLSSSPRVSLRLYTTVECIVVPKVKNKNDGFFVQLAMSCCANHQPPQERSCPRGQPAGSCTHRTVGPSRLSHKESSQPPCCLALIFPEPLLSALISCLFRSGEELHFNKPIRLRRKRYSLDSNVR